MVTWPEEGVCRYVETSGSTIQLRRVSGMNIVRYPAEYLELPDGSSAVDGTGHLAHLEHREQRSHPSQVSSFTRRKRTRAHVSIISIITHQTHYGLRLSVPIVLFVQNILDCKRCSETFFFRFELPIQAEMKEKRPSCGLGHPHSIYI